MLPLSGAGVILRRYAELVVRTHPYDALRVLRGGNGELIHASSEPGRPTGLRLGFVVGTKLAEYEVRTGARPPYVTARLAEAFGGAPHESVRINAGPTGTHVQVLTATCGDSRRLTPADCLAILIPKHHAFFAGEGETALNPSRV